MTGYNPIGGGLCRCRPADGEAYSRWVNIGSPWWAPAPAIYRSSSSRHPAANSNNSNNFSTAAAAVAAAAKPSSTRLVPDKNHNWTTMNWKKSPSSQCPESNPANSPTAQQGLPWSTDHESYLVSVLHHFHLISTSVRRIPSAGILPEQAVYLPFICVLRFYNPRRIAKDNATTATVR